jgi:hypothetical protein
MADESNLLGAAGSALAMRNPYVAGLAAIPSIIQGIQGIRQNAQANKMLRNIQFPEMNIPTAATESLGVARNLAGSFQMPGQAQAEQALNQQLAGGINNAVNTATSAPEALAASVALNANRMNAQNDILGQAAQSYMQRQGLLRNALSDYAEWQNNQWDWNRKQKFLYDAATASAMKQAGQINMFNAASNASGILANWAKKKGKGDGDGEGESVASGIAAQAATRNYSVPNLETDVKDIESLNNALSQYKNFNYSFPSLFNIQ